MGLVNYGAENRVAGLEGLVERAPQHVVREPVRDGDVAGRDLDELDRLPLVRHRAHGPLILVHQRDRADQRQILQVVAPGAGAVVEEGQFPGVGIHHTQRTQQSLGVLVDLEDRVALVAGEHPFERLAFALEPVDGLRPDHHDANPPQPITTTMAFSFATSAYDARW